jgi:hypothetical protein
LNVPDEKSWIFPVSGGKFWSRAENSSISGKFQAVLQDNYPGRFRRRQVMVLRHAILGPEISGILFAAYETAQLMEDKH